MAEGGITSNHNLYHGLVFRRKHLELSSHDSHTLIVYAADMHVAYVRHDQISKQNPPSPFLAVINQYTGLEQNALAFPGPHLPAVRLPRSSVKDLHHALGTYFRITMRLIEAKRACSGVSHVGLDPAVFAWLSC